MMLNKPLKPKPTHGLHLLDARNTEEMPAGVSSLCCTLYSPLFTFKLLNGSNTFRLKKKKQQKPVKNKADSLNLTTIH